MTASTKRRWTIIAGSVAVVLGGLYFAGYIMTGTRMPAHATVGTVDVGGMSPSDARHKLTEALSSRSDEPVIMAHDDTEIEVDPGDVGLALDAQQSIRDAGGKRSWNPADMVALFIGDHESDLFVDVDEDKLEDQVSSIADSVDEKAVEPRITFPKSKPKTRKPQDGAKVRRNDAAEAIVSSYLTTTDPVTVPTKTLEPTVGEDGLNAALKDIAKPAVSGPVTVKTDGKKLELPVKAYSPALVVHVVDGEMEPEIDPKALKKPLTSATTGFGKQAVDASFTIKNGKPEVIPGKPGVGLQPKEMSKKLVPVLTESGDARSVSVSTEPVDPEFTTKDAKKLKIKEKISDFSTDFPHAEYRNVNQSRAAELIDGTVLKPGETFSFNDTVGERTEDRGFTGGTVINGGVFRDELGGGVSQVATTTYNAAFFAGLEDIEHHPHAFYIDRYPVGREATVYFGNIDLRFRNNTDHGILIKSSVRKSSPGASGQMKVEMWGTKTWEIKATKSKRRNHRKPGKQYDPSNRCVAQAPTAGFDIDIGRIFLRGGKEVKRETDTAQYQAADHVICGEKPGKKKKKDKKKKD